MPCHFKYNIIKQCKEAKVLRSCTSWYNPRIFHLTSCETPQDKVGSSRSPLEVKKVVETGSTYDSHGHNHHRRATDPVGTIQNLTQVYHIYLNARQGFSLKFGI
jgi:hypothetical protein